jgi:hypothetical protein
MVYSSDNASADGHRAGVPAAVVGATTAAGASRRSGAVHGFLSALNGRWHFAALMVFGVIVSAHLVEHLVQAVQIFILGWARPEAGGVVGLVFPWLITSEWLHFGYAVVMLAGLVLLLPGFAGEARTWWKISLAIQIWHFLEHLLLFVQAQAGANLLGRAVPTSVLQLILPRVELHLFYNAVVMIPMAVAVAFHRYPRPTGRVDLRCTCSRLRGAPAA